MTSFNSNTVFGGMPMGTLTDVSNHPDSNMPPMLTANPGLGAIQTKSDNSLYQPTFGAKASSNVDASQGTPGTQPLLGARK